MKHYKVEAQAANRDRFRIETDGRDRALHFAAIFRSNQDYTWVAVEVDGRVYLGEAIGRIP